MPGPFNSAYAATWALSDLIRPRASETPPLAGCQTKPTYPQNSPEGHWLWSIQEVPLPAVPQKSRSREVGTSQTQLPPAHSLPPAEHTVAQVPLLSRTLSTGHGSAHMPLAQRPLQH
jgi:hypothetical protein